MKNFSGFLCLLLGGVAFTNAGLASELNESRIHQQAQIALDHLLQNLDHSGISSGAVIASPSQSNPNYFFHWVRDGALVMDSVRQVYDRSLSEVDRAVYLRHLLQWVDFESSVQKLRGTSAGLGEPKYNTDGSAFTGEWGRPQNDGSAARAITMIRLADTLIREGKSQLVREKLYSASLPATTPIKLDLEYTAHHWRESSYDLWEEVKGLHFYTRMLQRRALLMGADFATRMGDSGAASFYSEQALALGTELWRHADQNLGLIVPTLDQDQGWSHKSQSLDVAVVLGSLHASGADHFFSAGSEWILASADRLETVFQTLYPINHGSEADGLGTAIGRYPEDVYDGTGFTGGNPWFLATLAFAEMDCRAAQELETRSGRPYSITRLNASFWGKRLSDSQIIPVGTMIPRGDSRLIKMAQALRSRSESYFLRVLKHMNSQGDLYEQYQRTSGYLTGAPHLSWSYASYVTAYLACYPDPLN